MVTWHLTIKLFTAKCHERATLQKLWRQTGNSSLLPAKCWPLLHMIRACSWRWPDVVAGVSAHFSKFAFVLFCLIRNHLMTGRLATVNFVSLKSQCFPRLCCGKHWDSPKTKFTVPLGTSHWVLNTTCTSVFPKSTFPKCKMIARILNMASFSFSCGKKKTYLLVI